MNTEKLKQYQKEYYQANREAINRYSREYYDANKESILKRLTIKEQCPICYVCITYQRMKIHQRSNRCLKARFMQSVVYNVEPTLSIISQPILSFD